MKKLISTITALLILTSQPFITASAEENPDLNALASSLGADTDYLSVLNYKQSASTFNHECLKDFLDNCDILELAYAPSDTFGAAALSGCCYGISVLEVLAHNGVISPSDIMPGATCLRDITYSEEVDRLIVDYQAMQGYTITSNYEKYLVGAYDKAGMIGKMLDVAQSCMEKNKYFLITIRSENFSHAVCGIGCAEGSWTFDDVTYDKCVLILDSNAQTPEGDPKGFSEKGCIYINTETNQIHMPGYEDKLTENTVITPIDEDALLNCKGFIEPKTELSEELSEEISSLKRVMCDSTKGTTVNIIGKDGSISGIGDVQFMEWTGKASVIKAEAVEFSMKDEDKDFPNMRYIDTNRWMDVEMMNDYDYIYNGAFRFSDCGVRITNENIVDMRASIQIRMNDGSYSFGPFFWWSFLGDISKDIEAEIMDEGILLQAEDEISMIVSTTYYEPNGVTAPVTFKEAGAGYIKSKNNVLVKASEDGLSYFIDDNDDGAYDTPVEQGDADFDGKLDSTDASAILQIYSDSMTGSESLEDKYYKICDRNEDGIIDSADATEVLEVYAKRMNAK